MPILPVWEKMWFARFVGGIVISCRDIDTEPGYIKNKTKKSHPIGNVVAGTGRFYRRDCFADTCHGTALMMGWWV